MPEQLTGSGGRQVDGGAAAGRELLRRRPRVQAVVPLCTETGSFRVCWAWATYQLVTEYGHRGLWSLGPVI